MYEKKHICNNCMYFNAFYTKGIVKFNKKSYGECGKTKNQVKYSDECDFWEDNAQIHKKRNELALYNMISSLERINEIINLIKTDRDEE